MDSSTKTDILLVFPYQVKQEEQFQKIYEDFDANGYIVHYFDNNIKEEFDMECLVSVVNYFQEEYKENLNRIVVMSNVKELIFIWYRIYNSIISEFIYFNDGDHDLMERYMDNPLCFQLSNFSGITSERVHGKIYTNIDKIFNITEFLVCNKNYAYFENIDKFNKKTITTIKSTMCKKYIFENEEYRFLDSERYLGIYQVSIDSITTVQAEFNVENIKKISTKNVEIFFYIFIELYKTNSEKFFEDGMKILSDLVNLDISNKNLLVNLFTETLKNEELNFVDKAHLNCFLSALNGNLYQF